MEDDGEGGTRPRAANELADPKPKPPVSEVEAETEAEAPASSGKVFGGGAGRRPFGRIPIPMEEDGEVGLRPKAAAELDALKPEPAKGEE